MIFDLVQFALIINIDKSAFRACVNILFSTQRDHENA